ncbi:MAG: WbqC family protein [Nonlabens sp.]
MGNTIAIMQPYIFPYIGYFQLINYVDKFIFYDDVTFIKQGWINRNKITINDKEVFFTIPLSNASSYTLIQDIKINQNLFSKVKKKLYKSIKQSYGKAPFFNEAYEIIEKTFELNTDSMSEMAKYSVKQVSEYLELNTEFAKSQNAYDNLSLSGQDRVIDIATQEKAVHYVNPIGGKELYSSDIFRKNNLDLSFIKVNDSLDKKLIIDLLMNHSKEQVRSILNQYTIVK